MTEEQFNKLLNVLSTQAVLMHGIMNLLQAMNVRNGASPAALQFKDAQKIFEATAASIKVPG